MNDLTPSSVTLSEVDANAIAYALAKNACGPKLPLTQVADTLKILPETLKMLIGSTGFRAKYNTFVTEITESGESFKLKARVQAEELLSTQWEIIHDRDAPHSVRMKGIENVVEWAGLGEKKNTEKAAPPSITINIDLGGAKPEVIDVTPAQGAINDQTSAN